MESKLTYQSLAPHSIVEITHHDHDGAHDGAALHGVVVTAHPIADNSSKAKGKSAAKEENLSSSMAVLQIDPYTRPASSKGNRSLSLEEQALQNTVSFYTSPTKGNRGLSLEEQALQNTETTVSFYISPTTKGNRSLSLEEQALQNTVSCYTSPCCITMVSSKGKHTPPLEEQQQDETDILEGNVVIPDELIYKILTYLPMLSLCRFLTLNKYWMPIIKKLFFTLYLEPCLPLQVQPLTSDRFPVFLSVGANTLRNFTFDLVLNRWDAFSVASNPALPTEAKLPVASAGGLICYASSIRIGYYWIANPVTGLSELVTPDRRIPRLLGMGRLHELIVHDHSLETYTLLVMGVFQYPSGHRGISLDSYGTMVYTSTTGRWENVRGPHFMRYLWRCPPFDQRSQNVVEYGPPLNTVVCGQYWMVMIVGDRYVHTFDWRECLWRLNFKPDLVRDLCAPQGATYYRGGFKVATLTDPRFENFYTQMEFWSSYSYGYTRHAEWLSHARSSCFVHGDRVFIVGRNGRDIGYFHLVEKNWNWIPPFPDVAAARLPGWRPHVEVKGFPFSPSFTRKVGVLRRQEPNRRNQGLLRTNSITFA